MSIKVLLVLGLVNGHTGNVEQAVVRQGFETKAECNQVLLSIPAADLPEGYYVVGDCVDSKDWLIIRPKAVEKLDVNPA